MLLLSILKISPIEEPASLSFQAAKPKSGELEIRVPLSLVWFEQSAFPWYLSREPLYSSKAGYINDNLSWLLSSLSLTLFSTNSGISSLRSVNMDQILDKICLFMSLTMSFLTAISTLSHTHTHTHTFFGG